jgi:hypothetical protein
MRASARENLAYRTALSRFRSGTLAKVPNKSNLLMSAHPLRLVIADSADRREKEFLWVRTIDRISTASGRSPL